MRIVCKVNKGCDLSTKTLAAMPYAKTIFNSLQIGQEYTVYGISLYKNVVLYLISDTPSWYPAELFNITDPLVYTEWHFHFYGDFYGLNAIWGYKELLDPVHYDNLLDGESEDLAIFEKRKQEIDEYEARGSKRLEPC